MCDQGHPYPPEVVRAAQKLLDSALALVVEFGCLESEKLLRTVGEIYGHVTE